DFRNPGGVFGSDTFGVGLAPYFAARFTGQLEAPFAGDYVFTIGAAGGARLRIDGTTVAEVTSEGYTEAQATVSLLAGARDIEVLSFHNEAPAELQLSWSPPGEERDLVPPAALRHGGSFTTQTDAAGEFSIADVPTNLGSVRATVTAVLNDQPVQG